MAGDEYSIGGGKLKLKGSKVSGGRIEKKKKKSSKKKEEKAGSPEGNTKNTETGLEKSDKDETVRSEEGREQDAPGKTETEKKYEEIRRKRVCIGFFFFFLLFRCHIGPRLIGRSYMNDFNEMASRLIRSVSRI